MNKTDIRKFAIIANKDRDGDFVYTKTLMKSIIDRGGEIISPGSDGFVITENINSIENCDFFKNCDIAVCLGGDGTFLKAARTVYRYDKPMLGINLGSLGFLTEIEKHNIDNAVESIFAGKYCMEERIMLEVDIYMEGKSANSDIVINDVVLSRGAISRILHVKTYINDVFVDNFPGDGLIISSPTGSTAYTLSAGGPVVEPDTDLIIVTPICPHILYSRSFITSGDSVVKAIVDERFDHMAMVTVDGQNAYKLSGGDMIQVRRSDKKFKMISLKPKNFFNVLRNKIYYRGENQ